MRQRNFLIEPKYSDPDTFCNFIVGSDRVRASIQIYADIEMLLDAANALEAPRLLEGKSPTTISSGFGDGPVFDFELSVSPDDSEGRRLQFSVFQDYLDDGAPFRAEISFKLTKSESQEFAKELRSWCRNPNYVFIWKGD